MLFSQILASIGARAQGESGEGESGLIAQIGADWSQGRASFGGIVAALGSEAMRRLVAPERPLRGLDVTFVGPAFPGEVHLPAEILRVGKVITIAQSRVVSAGQVAATLTAIYGAPRPSQLNLPPQTPESAAPPEDLPDAMPPPASIGPHFTQHFDIRWIEGSHRPFIGAAMSHSKAYIRHRDPSALTESHLVGLLDCIWTPSLQRLSAVTPSSSLNWRLEFLRHDYSFAPQAWWRIDTQTNAAAEGYISHSSVVMDPNGAPSAFSYQLVAVFG
jgi:acyl-CoA thioesterase